MTLQRLSELFVSSALSIQQSRSFDAVSITVLGCVAAVADAVLRRLAVDEPSLVRYI